MILLVKKYSGVLVSLDGSNQIEKIEDDENKSKDAVSCQTCHKVGRHGKTFCDGISNQMHLLRYLDNDEEACKIHIELQAPSLFLELSSLEQMFVCVKQFSGF